MQFVAQIFRSHNSPDRNMKIIYLSLLAWSVCTLLVRAAAEPDVESRNLKKGKSKLGKRRKKAKGKGGGSLEKRRDVYVDAISKESMLKNLKAFDAIAEENGGDLSEGSAGLEKALDYIQAEFELLKDTFEVIEQPCKSMPRSTHQI
jgi:hypothetical protein